MVGEVPAVAQQASATDLTLVAPDACPLEWPALGPLTPGGKDHDGNVTVLVGGNLTVTEQADGAEGIVVVRGAARFERGGRGPYEVGVTAIGSGITPPPDSDMLVVGGDLTGSPGVAVDVGRGLAGDVVVGGALADGTQVDLHGGRLDAGVRQATEPYDAALASIADKSAVYAGRPETGTVQVTDATITLIGDGESDPQVFNVDGAGLGALDGGLGRSLQVLGVPDGAGVIVNLTGPVVDLDVDAVLAPGGDLVDVGQGRYFPDLATHLLWNAPTAGTVNIGGLAQLPGSLLVPNGSSTTTLAGAGTNGRVLVAGDLVHAGPGQLHSYPFLRNPDLSCGPEVEHFGAVTLDVVLKDPRDLVSGDGDRVFKGVLTCRLQGDDVTPGDGSWTARPGDETQVLTGKVPVGAICQLEERLEGVPDPGWNWAEPEIEPDKLVVAKRDPRGFKVTNTAVPEPPPPPPPPPPTETPSTPTETPTPVEPEPTQPLPSHEPTAEPTPTVEPTGTPDPQPSGLPTPEPDEPSVGAPEDEPNAGAEPPQRASDPGPLTTTAPFTLRGAFVWGPLLLLSVLALRLRAPWQRKRRRLH